MEGRERRKWSMHDKAVHVGTMQQTSADVVVSRESDIQCLLDKLEDPQTAASFLAALGAKLC